MKLMPFNLRHDRMPFTVGIWGLTYLIDKYKLQDLGIEQPVTVFSGGLAVVFLLTWIISITTRVSDTGASRWLGICYALLILSVCIVSRVVFAVQGSRALLLFLALQFPLMLTPRDAWARLRANTGKRPRASGSSEN
jgi:hypothetical protein